MLLNLFQAQGVQVFDRSTQTDCVRDIGVPASNLYGNRL